MTVFWKIVIFLVYMYYTHPSYRTGIVGKSCAYYIRIFAVLFKQVVSMYCRYVEAKKDRVTAIFSTVFRDDDDVIIGKVFMQVCSLFLD